MKLSVIVPSIRTERLGILYKSIEESYTGEFELIVITPASILFSLAGKKNVTVITSKRSPAACQQQGLLEATGDYVTWAADDGVFQFDALNESMYLLRNQDYKTIIVGRYLEGNNPIGMNSTDYFKFKYHKVFRLAGVPQEGYIVNCGVVSRKLLLELGGWDAENFDVPTMAHADFSIRANAYGCKFIMQDGLMFKCSHMPGKTGDHKPIHNAQIHRDQPRFVEMYSFLTDRVKIDINNWKNTPEVWKERFGR